MRNYQFGLAIFLAFVSHRAASSVINNEIDYRSSEDQTRSLDQDPDVGLPTLDIIKRAGYPAEAHLVTTSDGYILEVHRIPGGNGSIPVFLQHGLLSSSADWVITGKSKSLAYLLADRGYDVWLGNARGNTYSRAHTTLSTTDSEFWNFSWDEMGLYDLPAVISYITNYKKDSLIYIGHSMGTTMFYVMASKRPDIAEKVRVMIALAPVAYLSHVKTPMRIVAPFAHNIEMIAHFLGADEFLPQNVVLKYLAKYGCELDTLEENICENWIFVICGFDKAQFNTTLMPVILSHSPAGTSTRTLVHYGQEIASGRFQAYDYGSSLNRKYYNTTKPPVYDLSKIQVPVALFVADNDWLASPIDVQTLFKQLPEVIGMYKVNFTKFNHVDFLWGIDAPKLVYQQVFSVIEAYHANTQEQNKELPKSTETPLNSHKSIAKTVNSLSKFGLKALENLFDVSKEVEEVGNLKKIFPPYMNFFFGKNHN